MTEETKRPSRIPAYNGETGSPRVLIVDDEPAICRMLTMLLKRDFAVADAGSAEDAVPFLDHHPPDVFLLDKNLPGMSGIEFLRIIKERSPDSEVIIATAYASLGSSIEAMQLGAYDYIKKPFDDVKIISEKVGRAAKKKRDAEERRALMEQVLVANEELRSMHRRLKQSYIQTLASMIAALEARDPYTRGHSDRVAEYTALIGGSMDLAEETFSRLIDAARLHDLGKIGIREDVLNKPGRLVSDEYEHIRTHPTVGADIIGKMEAYQHLVPIVRHHHERFDGKGYPDGLSGEGIPLESRIIAVADTYDAITSRRPYRAAMNAEKAFVIIESVAGTQLDETVVGVFSSLRERVLAIAETTGAEEG